MSAIGRRLTELIRSEDGPTATEYAAMLSLVAFALLTMMGPLQAGWIRLYNTIGAAVDSG